MVWVSILAIPGLRMRFANNALQARKLRLLSFDELSLSMQFVLLPLDHFSLLFYLRLLFLDCIEQDNCDAVIFDAFDLAFVPASDEQRFDIGDFFGDQTQVGQAAVFPCERNRTQAADQIETGRESTNIFLVTDAGRAERDFLGPVSAKWRSCGACAKSGFNHPVDDKSLRRICWDTYRGIIYEYRAVFQTLKRPP